MYLQHGGRVTKRLVMFSDISDNILLLSTQLIESTEDLWANCDVSVDELVGASQQFDVYSLYDDDAEKQQSATISSKQFAEPLSVCCSAQSFSQKYRQWRDVGGYPFSVIRSRRCIEEQHSDLIYLNEPCSARKLITAYRSLSPT